MGKVCHLQICCFIKAFCSARDHP